MKIQTGAGVWGAFWLMPQAGGAQFELDVFEGGWQPTSFDINHHEDTNPPYEGGYNLNDTETVSINPSEYFNAGVHLKSTSTDYYVNGELKLSYPRPCTVDMFPILNLALGGPGSYPGSIDDTTPFPVVFEVDEVAVWSPLASGGTKVVISLAGAGGGVGAFNMGSNCDHPRGSGFTTVAVNGNDGGGTLWSAANWETGRQIIQNAINSSGADQVIIHGFSIGGMFAQEIVHRGETFGGKLRGVVIDDPARNWGIFNNPLNAAGFVNPAGIPLALYGAYIPDTTTFFVDYTYSDFGYMQRIAGAYGVTLKVSSLQGVVNGVNYAAPGGHRPNTRSTNGTGPLAPIEIADGRWWT